MTHYSCGTISAKVLYDETRRDKSMVLIRDFFQKLALRRGNNRESYGAAVIVMVDEHEGVRVQQTIEKALNGN